MNIEFNVLDRQFQLYSNEYKEAANRVLESGWYILGEELENFEMNFSNFMGSKYCIGLNSGLDALILAIRALNIGPGDEVIVPANTFIASVIGITENKAIPIFVEPDEFYNLDSNKIENAVSSKTKAILVVHLYGQAANMRKIKEIADRNNLFLIEDCAQSHGAMFDGQLTGTFGDIGCFSFFPTKNMGAFGDAGAIVTNNKKLSDIVRMLRNYGSKEKYHNEIEGVNSRLDELQAAFLDIKLKHLKELNDERISIAKNYSFGIKSDKLILPCIRDKSEHVYHLYVIRCSNRDLLKSFLFKNGIKTQVHYPIPPHLAECYRKLGYKQGDFPITEQYANELLSLPLYNGMRDEEIGYVIEKINEW
jgi:dTDP-4-amino-4,6-dideoxygalactose transaminase